MKVVILAGGYGTRFGRLTDFLPKPMIPVGPHPILWHIMKGYAQYGFCEFVICVGYKAELIKEFVETFKSRMCDFTVSLRDGSMTIDQSSYRREYSTWKISVAYTGQDTMTGGRIARIRRHIDTDDFLLTYGDGVSDIDIQSLVSFHKQHGRIATLSAVHPPPRFGDLVLENGAVKRFAEKQRRQGAHLINGGFYVFNKRVFDYLSDNAECVLEKEPLERLADEGELMAFEHRRFWQCMDTQRDMDLLNAMWRERRAPWKVWNEDYVE